jgi:hypothetical protein
MRKNGAEKDGWMLDPLNGARPMKTIEIGMIMFTELRLLTIFQRILQDKAS